MTKRLIDLDDDLLAAAPKRTPDNRGIGHRSDRPAAGGSARLLARGRSHG